MRSTHSPACAVTQALSFSSKRAGQGWGRADQDADQGPPHQLGPFYLTRLRIMGPPKSGPPSDLVVRVISSPLTMPSPLNVAGLPPMSTSTLKETLSPITLPSFSGKGSPPGPATVPVNFSPSCLKAYVRVNGLSPICRVPDQLPETSAASAAPAKMTQSTAVARRIRRVMTAILPPGMPISQFVDRKSTRLNSSH